MPLELTIGARLAAAPDNLPSMTGLQATTHNLSEWCSLYNCFSLLSIPDLPHQYPYHSSTTQEMFTPKEGKLCGKLLDLKENWQPRTMNFKFLQYLKNSTLWKFPRFGKIFRLKVMQDIRMYISYTL